MNLSLVVNRCASLFFSMLLLGTGTPGSAQRHTKPVIPANDAVSTAWVGSWGASQTAVYGTETLPSGALDDATLRETVRLTAGGGRIRLHLSNAFGERPLVLRGVTVALPAAAKPNGGVVPGSVRPVLFAGQTGVSVPLGSEYLSDPLEMTVQPGSDLVVTLDIASAPTQPTLHARARATEFLLAGSHGSEATLTGATANTRWYFLAGVEVEQRTAPAAAVVTFGDSITDGHGATTDGNDRWPDVLYRRLQASAATAGVGVVNQGIGGNCLLQVCIGQPALARFDRDVLSVPGVKTVIVLEGINDLGALSRQQPQPAAAHAERVQRIEAAYAQIVARAHAHGIRVLGATLTPWMGGEYYHPGAAEEADRVAVNAWIRTRGNFDGVIDFEAAVRDPQRPDRMLPAYDSGDHLHPGPVGYQKMGEAVDLSLLLSGSR